MPDDREPLDYPFTKARLPKGWSYPLKRSRLDLALLEAGVPDHPPTWRAEGHILYASWDGEGMRLEVDAPWFMGRRA